MHGLQRALVAAITRYQQRGGGREQFRVECNFEPSCSEYAKQAISHCGVLKGVRLTVNRIGRCCDRDQVTRTIDPFVPGR